MPKLSAVVGSLVLAALSYGQQPLALSDVTRMVLERHPRALALRHVLLAAERNYWSAKSPANPVLTFTPGVSRFGSDEELLVTLPLEVNGTRTARAAIAKAELSAAEAEALDEVRELMFEAKSAYLNLLRAEQRMNLDAEVAKGADALHQMAGRQVELGSRPGIERTQAAVELARAKQQQTIATYEYKSALAALNSLLGRGLDEKIELPPVAFQPHQVDEGAAIQYALAERPEMLSSRSKQEVFRQQANLARAEGYPDIVPQYRLGSVTRSPREGGFALGIVFSFLDFGERRQRVKQAQESATAMGLRQSAAGKEIEVEVKQAVGRLRATEEVLRMFEGGLLDDSRKLMDATRRGFELGNTSLATVLEAQRTYRSVQVEYIDNIVSYESALAELDRATGAGARNALEAIRTKAGKKL